jgi:hypothetical protein
MPQRELTSELRHRQQNRRATTTILVVLLLLFFAFWYAYSYYQASGAGDDTPATGATCRPYDPKVPTPATTTVNVYNATTKNGLAARTAAELRERGFVIGEVRNDPLRRTVRGPAELRFGRAGTPHAKLVIVLAGRGTTQVADKRKGTTVDLVLGSAFSALAPTPTPTGLPMCPSPSTSPSRSST